jgi:hypothetical protein
MNDCPVHGKAATFHRKSTPDFWVQPISIKTGEMGKVGLYPGSVVAGSV